MTSVEHDRIKAIARGMLQANAARNPDFTVEVLDLMIASAVSRELDERVTKRWASVKHWSLIIGATSTIGSGIYWFLTN